MRTARCANSGNALRIFLPYASIMKHSKRPQGEQVRVITKRRTRPRTMFARIGPGFITGASDDDPSGIGTYASIGAAHGLSALWLAPVSYPLMAAVQLICARIGLVTGKK